jgi:beta-galactosidase
VDDPSVKNINEYVARGGTLLLTFFSGIVDENEQIRLGGYPAPFRKMLGMVVEEYAPYPLGVKTTIATAEGKHFENQLWADVIHLEGAESLAKFEEDYFAGQAAITRHEFGKGLGYYLGTELEPAGISWLLERICRESGIQPVLSGLPASVEILKRANETKEWYFLLNHSGAPVQVAWEGGGFDLIQGRAAEAVISLDAYGAAVIEKEKP